LPWRIPSYCGIESIKWWSLLIDWGWWSAIECFSRLEIGFQITHLVTFWLSSFSVGSSLYRCHLQWRSTKVKGNRWNKLEYIFLNRFFPTANYMLRCRELHQETDWRYYCWMKMAIVWALHQMWCIKKSSAICNDASTLLVSYDKFTHKQVAAELIINRN
jgi:hypothetical protein